MRKNHNNELEKHHKLQVLNFDRNPTGRILTSDVQRHRKKNEFEEQKKKFTNVSHKTTGKFSNLRVILGTGKGVILLVDCSHRPSELAWSCNK